MAEETRRKFLRSLVADELSAAARALREAADHLDDAQLVGALLAQAEKDVEIARQATEAVSTTSGALLLDNAFRKKVLAASGALEKLAGELRGLPVTVQESRLVKRHKAERRAATSTKSRLNRDSKGKKGAR